MAECREHLVTLEADLLVMEKGGAEVDAELVNRVFRAVHSIKGGAGLFDLAKVPALAHQTENVLALIRSGKMVPTPERVRILLRATDKLREMIQDPCASDQADIAEIMAALGKLYEEHRPPTVKKASAPADGPMHRDAGHLRMLLVEDDFTSRLLLQSFLAHYGVCHVAVNGKEAIAAFRAALESGNPYDLICMDIMMPEMDGQTAVKEIRAIEETAGTLSTNGVKIIMATALDDVKNVTQSFQSLCDAYLVKPIDTGKLLAHLRDLHLI